MKKIIFPLSLIFIFQSFSNLYAQNEMRLLYQKAATEEASCKKLLHLLRPFNENNNALLAGYKASGTMMMAKYVFSPLRKLSFFSKGKKLMEKAIEKDKENIELRFLRFMVQTNAPSFLGYRSAIQEDKLFLIQSIPTPGDKNLEQFILSFLGDSDQLTTVEKQRLKP